MAAERRKWHVHLCAGSRKMGCYDHVDHFWLCHNPDCEVTGKYICGIIQDAINEFIRGCQEGGRNTRMQFGRDQVRRVVGGAAKRGYKVQRKTR